MKTRIFQLALVVVLSSIQCGCFEIMDAQRHMSETESLIDVHWNEQMGTAYEGLAFADSLKLDLYIPRDTSKAQHLILFVHGGGWTSGSRTDGELWCKYFNSLGYTAATVDYTLRTRHSKTDVNKVDSQLCAAVPVCRRAWCYSHRHGRERFLCRRMPSVAFCLQARFRPVIARAFCLPAIGTHHLRTLHVGARKRPALVCKLDYRCGRHRSGSI